MAESNDLDFAVAMQRSRQANQGIDQIQIPGIGAEFFHIAGDRYDHGQVAGGVGESARSAILGVGLPEAVLQRDAPILLPDRLALADLNRDQHEVGAGQQGRAARSSW